jgi:hypothetical protein
LRLAALQRVERMPFVLDRVIADADSGVRLAALGRIDDERQLERISERSRKSDKAISRLAAERAQALRIERGDASAIATHARAICASSSNACCVKADRSKPRKPFVRHGRELPNMHRPT